MDAKGRNQIRELNALRFSNLQNITLKKVIEAKQAYRKTLAELEADKKNYSEQYISERKEKIKSDYAAKLAGFHQELTKDIDNLQASIQEMQSTLDLSDPAWSNALKLIELGGKDLTLETVNEINQSFLYNQPALRALQTVYRSRGVAYDGGIDKMLYNVDDEFNRVRQAAEATFKAQSAGINSFASQLAKIAKLEGYQFEGNPDPDGFAEAAYRGAGLPMPQ
jgi:hypothetical protein